MSACAMLLEGSPANFVGSSPLADMVEPRGEATTSLRKLCARPPPWRRRLAPARARRDGGEERADGFGADQPHRRRGGLDAGEHRIAHFHHAEELPLRIERGGAGKSGHRHRLAQLDRAAVGQPRLDLGQLAAAVLLLRIGNADQRQFARLWARRASASAATPCSIRRRAAARARCPCPRPRARRRPARRRRSPGSLG